MTPEDIAQLHAERPGHTLVSYGEVGLPVYRIEVHALVLDPKDIGPFDEFVLRAVSEGVTLTTDLGRLIGLEARLLDAKLVDLLSSNDLAVRPEPGQSESALHLTPKGRQTLDTARSVVPDEVLIEFDYDGLLRRPVPFVENWGTARKLRDEGVREIPPSPVKPPQLEDLDLAAVRDIVRSLADRRQAKRDLLALRALKRRSLRFQPAIALIYKPRTGDDVQVAFALSNGRLSEEHESAFARTRFRKQIIRDLVGDEAPPERIAAELLGNELIARADRTRTLALHRLITAATQQTRDSTASTAEPPKTPETTAQAAQDELAQMLVRPLETFEHPQYLKRALATTANRLLIISPWLRRAVVDDAFLQGLESLLVKRVQVFLGWGISGPGGEDEDGDHRARQLLAQLATRHPTFHFKYIGDVHAKILLSDEQFVIVTSFNWLSYRGDPRRTFRDERGVLVAIKSVVEQQFQVFRSRFELLEEPT